MCLQLYTPTHIYIRIYTDNISEYIAVRDRLGLRASLLILPEEVAQTLRLASPLGLRSIIRWGKCLCSPRDLQAFSYEVLTFRNGRFIFFSLLQAAKSDATWSDTHIDSNFACT